MLTLKRWCEKPKLACLIWGLLSWRRLLPRLGKMNIIIKRDNDRSRLFFFWYPFTNRTPSWRGRCCARASLLWVPLQHWLSCWRGHYKYWHNESKKCPGEGCFQGPNAEKRLPSGRFVLNKGLISWNNNEAVTWSAAPLFHLLCHLLLRLSAVKESKKIAPSFLAPRVASLTPSALLPVRHQHFGAPVAPARGENGVTASLVRRWFNDRADRSQWRCWRCFGDGSKLSPFFEH